MADDPLREAWEAGRTAWPDVALDHARFVAFAAGAAPEAARRFPADLYLAAACLAGDDGAHAAFDRELLAAARGAIRAIDAGDAFVDEAFQRLRASLLVGDGHGPRIADYAGRGPLRAWVGISAARTALMMRREQHRAREVAFVDDWAAAVATISTSNPELELLKRQYAAVFQVALRDAIRALEPRLLAVLRMSFVEALSIDEIAGVYAVHRATAARWIQRACDAIFEATRSRLAEQLAVSSTEIDRMTALVRSQIEVSISQVLPVLPGRAE